MVKNLLYLFFSVFIISCSINTNNQKQLHLSGILVDKKITWSGEIFIDKDLLISKDSEVRVMPGTKIYFVKADISRTEPIFLYPETELLLKGKLIIDGKEDNPVIFQSSEQEQSNRNWAGIVVQDGEIKGKHFIIKHAYNGIAGISGYIEIEKVHFDENYIGIALLDNVYGDISDLQITKGQTGMIISSKNVNFKNILASNNNEGVIIRQASPFFTNIYITKNVYGLILDSTYLHLLLGDNKIYENKNNIYLFDTDKHSDN